MRVSLEKIERINKHLSSFWFKPPKKVGYTAGQFIEMTLPHAKPDERGTRHWFTLSSSPTEELISITTRYAGEEGSSFKRVRFGLKIKSRVEMSDPMGDFVLPKDKNMPLVFVAGGIGVTPFRSMVKWLIDTKDNRNIQVILAANKLQDVLFKDLFEKYGIRPRLVISNPPDNWDGQRGQLTGRRVLTLINGIKDKRLYISGPEPMVETLNEELQALNVSPAQLVGDFFPGYSTI